MSLATIVFFWATAINDAEAAFEKVEAKLHASKTLQVSVVIEIENGQVANFPTGARFKGKLIATSDKQLRLELQEALSADVAEPWHVVWISDGKRSRLAVTGDDQPQTRDESNDLAARYRTVMSRSSVLMSLLPLPDVPVANEQERFPVSEFKLGDREIIKNREAQRLDYRLGVKGQPSTYSVSMWVDAASGLPLKRRITGGEGAAGFAWTESYELTLNAEVDPSQFALATSP